MTDDIDEESLQHDDGALAGSDMIGEPTLLMGSNGVHGFHHRQDDDDDDYLMQAAARAAMEAVDAEENEAAAREKSIAQQATATHKLAHHRHDGEASIDASRNDDEPDAKRRRILETNVEAPPHDFNQQQPDQNTASSNRASRIRRVGNTDTKSAPSTSSTLAAITVPPVTCALPAASASLSAHGSLAAAAAAATLAVSGSAAHLMVCSKHDQKWNQMFDKLLAYQQQHGDTLVPQCYDGDSKLGRWVHYQRVEYWMYQNGGKAKINEERIARLNRIGFEWDPQAHQWKQMYAKLRQFYQDHGHCKVPKGYTRDKELANWVRNQRLEYANLQRGRKSRMNDERIRLLHDVGFRWSTPMPSRSSSSPVDRSAAAAAAIEATVEDDSAAARRHAAPIELMDHSVRLHDE